MKDFVRKNQIKINYCIMKKLIKSCFLILDAWVVCQEASLHNQVVQVL
jgi:hypothetical protein